MDRLRSKHAAFSIVFLLAAGVRPVCAQRLTGVVRDSISRLPIPGAVVSAIDSAGHVGARTIANEGGRFTIVTPPSATRLRVIRLGFRPQELAIPGAREEDRSVDVAMIQLPALLTTVQVSAGKLCPGSSPRGAAFELWEQSRAGLMAAVVARETQPAIATTLVYERAINPGDALVRNQAVRLQSGRTTRPFLASAPPSEFAAKGYMQEVANERTYHAPDADVLLDPSFAATHCLRVEPRNAGHPGQVGLAFEPIPGRDSLVDVAGVLWLDGRVPELRTLEFRFTGLERAAQLAGVGGELTFRSMPNGVVFIERWVMRLPVMSQLPPATRSATRVTVRDDTRRSERLDLRVVEVREKGGEVLNAAWSDGARWESPSSHLAGKLTQQGTHRPVENAIIFLRGTTDTITSDATGRYAFYPTVPGHYVLEVADTALVEYTPARTTSRRIEVVRARDSDVDIELPPLDQSLAQLCKGHKLPDRSSIVIGRLTTPDGLPARGVELQASWQADYKGDLRRDPTTDVVTGRVAVLGAQQTVTPDAEGRFRACGVVRERPIHLLVRQDGASIADTTIIVYDSLVKRVDWVLRRTWR